jgi:hypothetical protein
MWSIALAAVGLTGLLIAARRPRIGWWFNIAAQTVWITYGIATEQYGFIVMSAGYTAAYVRLLRAAYRTTPQTVTDRDTGDTGLHLSQNTPRSVA